MLKTILIIAFIYYLIKFISPFIKRFILRKLGEKVNEQMNRGFNPNQNYQNQDPRKDGEVRVEKPASHQKKKAKTENLGEYTDFEEL
ncbi:MAG: DUF4834 family protein [Flavobacteriales bacterium]